MAVPSTPLFGNPTRVTTSVAIKASPGKLWAVQLEGGTAASSLDFKNATTDTGTVLFGVTAPFTDDDASAQSTVFIDLTPLGGIDFATGIYAKLTGANAIGYVWFS